jgi:hypothetical protein
MLNIHHRRQKDCIFLNIRLKKNKKISLTVEKSSKTSKNILNLMLKKGNIFY